MTKIGEGKKEDWKVLPQAVKMYVKCWPWLAKWLQIAYERRCGLDKGSLCPRVMDKAVLWSCEKGGQGSGRPRWDGLGRTELLMVGVMPPGKCCTIARLLHDFHEGHCITAVGGENIQEDTSLRKQHLCYLPLNLAVGDSTKSKCAARLTVALSQTTSRF